MPVLRQPPQPTHELGGTRFTSLATPSRGSTDTAVWTVEILPDTPSTPHFLTRQEVFVVLEGRATARIGETTEHATTGDVIVVPADVEFEVSNAASEPLRMLCCLPVGGKGRLADGDAFVPPWAE